MGNAFISRRGSGGGGAKGKEFKYATSPGSFDYRNDEEERFYYAVTSDSTQKAGKVYDFNGTLLETQVIDATSLGITLCMGTNSDYGQFSSYGMVCKEKYYSDRPGYFVDRNGTLIGTPNTSTSGIWWTLMLKNSYLSFAKVYYDYGGYDWGETGYLREYDYNHTLIKQKQIVESSGSSLNQNAYRHKSNGEYLKLYSNSQFLRRLSDFEEVPVAGSPTTSTASDALVKTYVL